MTAYRNGQLRKYKRIFSQRPFNPSGSNINTRRMVMPNTTGTISLYSLNTCGTMMTNAAPMMDPSMDARPPMMTATNRVIDSMKVNIWGSR